MMPDKPYDTAAYQNFFDSWQACTQKKPLGARLNDFFSQVRPLLPPTTVPQTREVAAEQSNNEISDPLLTLNELQKFFDTWQNCAHKQSLSWRLEKFFPQLDRLLLEREKLSQRKPPEPITPIDTMLLQQWFIDLKHPLQAVHQSGHFCDPWAVAKIRHDEVRNAHVLAWWLNPQGSHGLEGTLLDLLCERLKYKNNIDLIPPVKAHLCQVRTEESYQKSEKMSRVDIEIDCPEFFCIIEVKIYAPVKDDQLLRYCNIAEERAQKQSNREKRPWVVLFLTLKGGKAKPPKNANKETLEKYDHIIPISWKDMAILLTKATRSNGSQNEDMPSLPSHTNLLARAFVNHIRKF